MNEKFQVGNVQIALKLWEKYGQTRVYLYCKRADGSELPGKGHDGGHFDTNGYHGGKGGWIDSARYHDRDGWDRIEAQAQEMLK